MLRRVALVRTGIPPKRWIITRTTRRQIPEDGILHFIIIFKPYEYRWLYVTNERARFVGFHGPFPIGHE
jgi:hypothetical protein